jgi:hypothetical protein
VASIEAEVRSAVAVLERVVSEFEPGTFDVTGAKRLVDLFTRAERLAQAGRGLAARRVDRAVVWKRDGHRSAAHWLASATGVSIGSAMRSLETARRLEELPETADAFRAGELSESQASEIAAAASLDPSAEGRLLDRVRDGTSFREFRDDCREAKLRAADDRATAQRLHETRSVRTWSDGHWCLEARLRPDEGDRVRQVLEHKTDELFLPARAEGRREPRAAYAADALVAVMSGDLPAKPIESRLDGDLAAIERGYVLPGERCELEGVGPIPVTIARALLGDAKLVLMVREGSEITKISSAKRGIPIALRRSVERRYPRWGRRLRPNRTTADRSHRPGRRTRSDQQGEPLATVPPPPHAQDALRMARRHRPKRRAQPRLTRRPRPAVNEESAAEGQRIGHERAAFRESGVENERSREQS